jgi:hypothetical protein
MPSSGMLHRVAFVRTEVSEECIASIIRVTRVGDIVFLCSVLQLLVTADIPSSLMMEAIHSSEMSILTRATWCNIPEDGILKFSSWCITLIIAGFLDFVDHIIF